MVSPKQSTNQDLVTARKSHNITKIGATPPIKIQLHAHSHRLSSSNGLFRTIVQLKPHQTCTMLHLAHPAQGPLISTFASNSKPVIAKAKITSDFSHYENQFSFALAKKKRWLYYIPNNMQNEQTCMEAKGRQSFRIKISSKLEGTHMHPNALSRQIVTGQGE